jgi:hypothetical protein
MPEPQRREVQETIRFWRKILEHIMHQIPAMGREGASGEIRKLNRDTAMFAVGQSIDEVKAKFPDVPRVIEHLEAVRGDLIDNAVADVRHEKEGENERTPTGASAAHLSGTRSMFSSATRRRTRRRRSSNELHPTLANSSEYRIRLSTRRCSSRTFA